MANQNFVVKLTENRFNALIDRAVPVPGPPGPPGPAGPAGPPGPPGAITPWTEDVDASGHSLNNVGHVTVPTGGGITIGGATQVANSINITGQFLVNGVPVAGAGVATPAIFSVNGTQIGTQPELNLIAGSNATLTGFNNAGALRVDVTVNAVVPVTSVNGHTGAVVLTTADTGGVPATRQIIAGLGLTGGGDLSADRTLSVVADTTVQQHRVSLAGALVGTRREINFVQGSGISLSVTDDSVNNRVTVSVTGTSGAPQTPWLSDIDAAGFRLITLSASNKDLIFAPNVTERMRIMASSGNVGIGTASPSGPLHVATKGSILGAAGGSLTAPANTDANVLLYSNSSVNWAGIGVDGNGHAWFRTGTSGTPDPRIVILATGNVGIGVTSPGYKLDIAGDCNLSAGSVYRIGGVPIGTGGGGTPAGSTGQVQYNNAGAFGASANLCWNIANNNLGIGNDGTGLAFSGYPQVIVGPVTNTGKSGLVMACGNATSSGVPVGSFSGVNWAISASEKRIGEVRFDVGATPDTGDIVFNNWQAGVANERARIKASGLVGIGTSGPTDMLTVAGAMSVNPVSGDSAIYLRQNGVSKARLLRDTTGGYMSLWTQDAYPFALGVNGAISVWLANGGNVGIGTTSPQGALHVFGISNVPSLSANGASLVVDTNNGSQMILGSYTSSPYTSWLQVKDHNNNGSNYPLSLNPLGGSVGIGTTSPGYTLDVVGGDVNIQSSYAYRVNGYPCPKINFYLDQTGSRSLGPTYQNTYGVPMFVAVTCVINAGQFINLLTDINNPPNNVVMAQSNVGGVTITATVNGWVMPTQYYRINTGGASITKWYEWT